MPPLEITRLLPENREKVCAINTENIQWMEPRLDDKKSRCDAGTIIFMSNGPSVIAKESFDDLFNYWRSLEETTK